MLSILEIIADESLRYIDWEKRNPYTFLNEDYAELCRTDLLFERKFDEKVSAEVVDRQTDVVL